MAAMLYQFMVTALDANGKEIFSENMGGELPRKCFDDFFNEVCERAALNGGKTILIDEFKRNNSQNKTTTTYSRMNWNGKKWTKEQIITKEEYDALIDG